MHLSDNIVAKVKEAFIRDGHNGIAHIHLQNPEFFHTKESLANRTFMMQPKPNSEGKTYIKGKWVLDIASSEKVISDASVY